MSESVFIIESEWDIGEEGLAYLSEEDAIASITENSIAIELAESHGVSVESLIEQNLIRVVELRIE